MNRTIISSILCIVFINSYGQVEGLNRYVTPEMRITGLNNNLINNNLKGNVLSVNERNWYIKKANGKWVRSKLSFSVFYKYDSMGNEILKIEIDKNGWYKGDTLISGHSYKYDQAGRIIEMYESIYPVANDSQFTTKTLCKYNEKGELIEKNTYNDHLEPYGSSVFKYDTHGNLIVSEFYGHGIFKGSSEKTVFCYTSDKLIGEMYYEPVDTLNSSAAIKYDQKGNRTDSYKSSKYKQGNYTKTTKYDLNGNVLEQTAVSGEGKIIWSVKHTYTYDVRGNWIKEIYAEYRKKPLITEREIEYYSSSDVNVPQSLSK